MTTDSPMYNTIRQVVERWHLNTEDATVIYHAITDDIFYQELGHRLGTNHQPIVLPEFELKPIKWEYFVKDLYIDGQAPVVQTQILDHYGQQGWELTTVSQGLAYFKRPCGS